MSGIKITYDSYFFFRFDNSKRSDVIAYFRKAFENGEPMPEILEFENAMEIFMNYPQVTRGLTSVQSEGDPEEDSVIRDMLSLGPTSIQICNEAKDESLLGRLFGRPKDNYESVEYLPESFSEISKYIKTIVHWEWLGVALSHRLPTSPRHGRIIREHSKIREYS